MYVWEAVQTLRGSVVVVRVRAGSTSPPAQFCNGPFNVSCFSDLFWGVCDEIERNLVERCHGEVIVFSRLFLMPYTCVC